MRVDFCETLLLHYRGRFHNKICIIMLKAASQLINKQNLTTHLKFIRNFAAAKVPTGPAAKIVPPQLNEDESFVDMDSEKLIKYCCVNYAADSQPFDIKPDSEYPSWLWELKLGDPPSLDELDPNYYPYWEKVQQIYEEQLTKRKSTRYVSSIVQHKNWRANDREFFELDEERKKELH